MKVDFKTPILDLHGKEIIEDKHKVTLGSVCCSALITVLPNENQNAEGKVRRFQMALIAAKGGKQDITVEQVVELKELIGRCFGPLVVGRVHEIFDAVSK